MEELLKSGLPLVQDEPSTTAWFGIRLGRSTFAIFDAFPDEEGRQAHLSGKLAKALMAKAPDLLVSQPYIQEVEVLGAKLPGAGAWKQKMASSKGRNRNRHCRVGGSRMVCCTALYQTQDPVRGA